MAGGFAYDKSELVIGVTYWVTYRPTGRRTTWELCATYMGEDYRGIPLFDMRPIAGTIAIDAEEIINAESTLRTHAIPRKVA